MAPSVGCFSAWTMSAKTRSATIRRAPSYLWALATTWRVFCAGARATRGPRTRCPSCETSSRLKRFAWTDGRWFSGLWVKKLRDLKGARDAGCNRAKTTRRSSWWTIILGSDSTLISAMHSTLNANTTPRNSTPDCTTRASTSRSRCRKWSTNTEDCARTSAKRFTSRLTANKSSCQTSRASSFSTSWGTTATVQTVWNVCHFLSLFEEV